MKGLRPSDYGYIWRWTADPEKMQSLLWRKVHRSCYWYGIDCVALVGADAFESEMDAGNVVDVVNEVVSSSFDDHHVDCPDDAGSDCGGAESGGRCDYCFQKGCAALNAVAVGTGEMDQSSRTLG